jgi:hypothetical protein
VRVAASIQTSHAKPARSPSRTVVCSSGVNSRVSPGFSHLCATIAAFTAASSAISPPAAITAASAASLSPSFAGTTAKIPSGFPLHPCSVSAIASAAELRVILSLLALSSQSRIRI